MKRHPVTSATVVRVRIDDERAGPPPSSIQTYKQSWISTAAADRLRGPLFILLILLHIHTPYHPLPPLSPPLPHPPSSASSSSPPPHSPLFHFHLIMLHFRVLLLLLHILPSSSAFSSSSSSISAFSSASSFSGSSSSRTRGTPGPLSLSTLRRCRPWISTFAYMSLLMMAAAPHVHRQYRHVRPWRKSLGGVSLSTPGIRRICPFAGKCTGNVSPTLRQRQRAAILLLFVSNPTRRHRHLHCPCYFKRRHRGTRIQF